jgi:hypothetical protein
MPVLHGGDWRCGLPVLESACTLRVAEHKSALCDWILHLRATGVDWYYRRQPRTKRAAGTAAGFTGIFGYASTVLSGWGLGALVDKHGWNAGFLGLVCASAIGTLLFAAAWGPGRMATTMNLRRSGNS